MENGKQASLDIKLFQTNQNHSSLNASLFFPKDVSKLMLHIIINYAANLEDTKYQVEFFKATLDAEQFIKNMRGNFITREIVKNLLDSLDFQPDFPLKAVSKYACSIIL